KTQRKEVELLHKNITVLQEKQSALIQKNLQGVLSDAILKKELEKIEEQITHMQTLLPQEQKGIPSYTELLNVSSEYLKNPGNVWIEAPFHLKKKLQWFQFAK